MRLVTYWGPIDGIGVLEQPFCRKLVCWLARKADAVGRDLGFCPGMEGLESVVLHQMYVYSPLGSFCVFVTCVSEFL